jgi:adenylate cyclase
VLRERDELDLVHWLAGAGLSGTDEADILGELCRRLRGGGVPVDRAFTGVELVHPLVEGEIFHWTAEDDTVRQTNLDRLDKDRTEWLSSPLYRLHATDADELRLRVGDTYVPGVYPVVDRFVAEGGTDYLAVRAAFKGTYTVGERDETFFTFATTVPEGFRDEHVDLLRRIAAPAANALRATTGRRTAYAMMECYLGRDAGRRVLRGGIDRGTAEELDAVLWFGDLRGFTGLVDTMPPAELIPMLNGYAECQANAIHAHGGEVMKFIGDAVLGVFPRHRDGADACGRALDAAVDAYARLDALNRDRRRDGKATTSLYMGLHVGTVFYGNIGSSDRLDFTVVGPAVNEANRIAGMCKPLDKDVLISAGFAEADAEAAHRLVPMGRYAMRGVRQPQMLYTLDPTHARNRGAFG